MSKENSPTFELSNDHLQDLVRDVTHSIATQTGNYIHYLHLADDAFKKDDIDSVVDHLKHAEDEMNFNPQSSQPPLAIAFDVPSSILRTWSVHSSSLAHAINETGDNFQTHRYEEGTFSAFVESLIVAFNVRVGASFRSVRKKHTLVMKLDEEQDDERLYEELSRLRKKTEAFKEHVQRISRVWLESLRFASANPVDGLAADLHRRMNEVLKKNELK